MRSIVEDAEVLRDYAIKLNDRDCLQKLHHHSTSDGTETRRPRLASSCAARVREIFRPLRRSLHLHLVVRTYVGRRASRSESVDTPWNCRTESRTRHRCNSTFVTKARNSRVAGPPTANFPVRLPACITGKGNTTSLWTPDRFTTIFPRRRR